MRPRAIWWNRLWRPPGKRTNAAATMAPVTAVPAVERIGKRRLNAAAPVHHAIAMLWFFNGNERMRLPVALKYALSTAGAATQIVGSPTPPQAALPPDGMMIDSTFGISAMRIELRS